MFFENTEQMMRLAAGAGTTIFVVPDDFSWKQTNVRPFYRLEPNENGKILLEPVMEMIKVCALKQAKDAYVMIEHAETMLPGAQNALLKLLEEPRTNYHFMLLTTDLAAILPTIRSRANVYLRAATEPLSAPVNAPEEVKVLARELLTIDQRQLWPFVERLTKKKTTTRVYVLEILAAAIEIAYKSYFATGNLGFLRRVPNLITCHQNIKDNGHMKLHLVADLIA